MKNKLALVLLVLLVAGTVSLAVAQTRIRCTFCHETDWTTACYKCPGCGHYTSIDAYGASENPEDTYPINYCYWCTCDQWHMPDYLLCYSEICKGGIFYDF